MPLDKNIIKAQTAAATTFDYKPRDINLDASTSAKSFVNDVAFTSTDFKIAELIAKQAGILQLEDDARQDAINSQVLERFKEVEEKAYKEGYDLGLVEGTEKAFSDTKAELLEKQSALEELLRQVENQKSRILVDNEEVLIRLVYLTANKMALRDLEENREAVLEILKSVMGEIQADERVVVQISKQDLDFITHIQEKSGQKIESLERVKFVVNENIKPGGCKIETEFGSVDATVDERLERTWQTLQSRIPRNTPEQK